MWKNKILIVSGSFLLACDADISCGQLLCLVTSAHTACPCPGPDETQVCDTIGGRSTVPRGHLHCISDLGHQAMLRGHQGILLS